MALNQLRKFPRTKVDFPVTYELAGKKRRTRAVMLGGNGLLLQVTQLLTPGTELKVRFRPDKRFQAVEVGAVVRYQSPTEGVGVEFKTIRPEDRKVVMGLVLSRLRNKRVFPRRPLVVQVEHDAGSFLAFSRNISVGGMFIGVKDLVLATGAKLTLRFPIDDGGPTIIATAEVRYAVVGQGMGVKFIAIKAEDLNRIDLYVTKGESSVTAPGR